MPSIYRLLLLLLLGTFFGFGARAQSVTVTLSGFEQPVLTRPFVSDLEQRFTNGVHQMLVTVEGIPTTEYRFRYVVRRGNEQLATITSQPIRLEEGVHVFQFTENAGSGPDISFSQTQDQFINSLSGQLPRQILTTGRLPDGRYRFTVDVEMVNPSVAPSALLLGGEVVMEVRYPEPPRLSQPLNEEIVSTENPVFSWEAPLNVPPGALITYTLRIVPRPATTSQTEAMRQGLNGVEISGLTSTSYTYVDTPLEPGFRYDWQVTQTVDLSGAGDLLPPSELQNQGRSPIQSFFVLGNVSRTSRFPFRRTLDRTIGTLSFYLPPFTFEPSGDQMVVPTEPSYPTTFRGNNINMVFSPNTRLHREGRHEGTATLGPIRVYALFDRETNRAVTLQTSVPGTAPLPLVIFEIDPLFVDLATGEARITPGTYPATVRNLVVRPGDVQVTITSPTLNVESLSGLTFTDGSPALPYPMPRFVNAPEALPEALTRINYTYTLPLESSFPEDVAVSVSDLPPGLSFDAPSRTISGTPTEVGAYTLTFTLTDPLNYTATHTASLAVTPYSMPQWVNMPIRLEPATLGVEYTYQIPPSSISAWGNPQVSILGMPSGFSFNSATRTLTGRPTTRGNFTLTFSLVDAFENTATHRASLTIVEPTVGGPPTPPPSTPVAPPPAPRPNPPTSPPAPPGAPTGPPTLGITPPGAPSAPPPPPSAPTLGSTPTPGGQGSGSTPGFFQWQAGSSSLTARPIPDARATAGQDFQVNLPPATFSGPSNVVTVEARQANGSPLPSWLTFSPSTGVFSGRPPAGLNARIQVEVIIRDAQSRQTSANFEIQVSSSTTALPAGPLGSGPISTTQGSIPNLGPTGGGNAYFTREIPAPGAPLTNTLSTGQGVGPWMVPSGQTTTLNLPQGTFRGSTQLINVEATLQNRQPLPEWIRFEPTTGAFTFSPPSNAPRDFFIFIHATGTQNLSATNQVRVFVSSSQ